MSTFVSTLLVAAQTAVTSHPSPWPAGSGPFWVLATLAVQKVCQWFLQIRKVQRTGPDGSSFTVELEPDPE